MTTFSINVKCTCDCCGYVSLPDNSMRGICPICYWQVEYFDPSDLFCASNANYITLYEAKENYSKYGAYKYEYVKFCRPPSRDEIKDKEWRSIQDKFDSKYRTKLMSVHFYSQHVDFRH